MKPAYLALTIAVSILMIAAGCSKGYESQKSAGDLEITLRTNRYPIIPGDNSFSVSVADTSGKAVTRAAVQARYYTQAKPGITSMEFKTDAVPKGKSYAFSANIPGAGGWKIDVIVSRPGKPALTATFAIDAR
jgi:hypothetical protein